MRFEEEREVLWKKRQRVGYTKRGKEEKGGKKQEKRERKEK